MSRVIQVFVAMAALSCMVGAVSIVTTYQHDNYCYTQGFEFVGNSQLVESCGMYGKSRVMVRELDRTKTELMTVRRTQLDIKVFGEGVTLLNDKFYVLTWREHRVLILNRITLEKERELRWPRQGWGLTNNSTHLFLSDGTPNIFILD